MTRKKLNGFELVKALKGGSVRALARLISYVETRAPTVEHVLQYIYPDTGFAYVVGITGPAGSGKSSLVNRLALEMRKNDYGVGIIACDPTSPFSGGAILGDRLRMQHVANDTQVFIRSLGTRGHLGGLAKATGDVVHLMDAFGKDFIIIETVGAGQDEVDVVKLADTCVVVMVPGLGDEIQTIKAGIMEIGDIFVVNKADRPEADWVVQGILDMLNLKPKENEWDTPVLQTVATQGEGIEAFFQAILDHREYLEASDQLARRRRERIKLEVINNIIEEISRHVDYRISEEVDFERYVDEVSEKKKDPYSLSQEILWPITKHL
jgi:LAO/AO transport system kinase